MEQTKKQIMVVEDDEFLLNAITKELAIHNYSSITFRSGKDALHHINSTDQLPDAIWLDYYLLDMNGLEFVSEFKYNKTLSEIPIVVVSNSENPVNISAFMDMGVKKYVVKTQFKLEEIIKTFDELLNLNG